MREMFNAAVGLSDSNKGEIHKSFSSNELALRLVGIRDLRTITDANFQDAVNLWFSDEANATHTYGHIRDWNVSAVTDMSEAFMDRSTFNEDISGWDVECHQNDSIIQGSVFVQPTDWRLGYVFGSMDGKYVLRSVELQ